MLTKHYYYSSVVLVLGLTVCVGILLCSKLPLSQSTDTADLFAQLRWGQEESDYTEGQKSYFARKRIIDGAIANATGNERPELMTDRERSATEHTPPAIIVDM